jgi:hypothetical protein
MNRIIRISLWLTLLMVFALPGTAFAKGLMDDRVITGGTFTLADGEIQNGNLLIFGGAVRLEDGSQVNGDVVLMGGTLTINGNVNGNVVGIGGVVSLGSSAIVEGSLTTLAATLDRESGSQVKGDLITGFQGPFRFNVPGGVTIPNVPNVEVGVPAVWEVMWFFFRTFLWAALAVVIVMFLPSPTNRTATTIRKQPVLAGGIGLLTAIIAPLLLVGIAITIILIPVSLIGALILAIAWFFGRIALGLEIGKRFAESSKQKWSPAVAAGVGTFILTFAVDGVDALIPCVGWLLPALVGIIGLGGVLLSRFGTQIYPVYAEAGIPPQVPQPPTPTSQISQNVESDLKPSLPPSEETKSDLDQEEGPEE